MITEESIHRFFKIFFIVFSLVIAFQVSISSITSKSLKSNLLLSDNIDKICEPVYSDPLDALEEEDEDIYESLEDVIKDDERIASDHESSEDEYDDLKVETRCGH